MPHDRSARRLSIGYVIALSIIALLSLVSEFLVRQALQEQEADGTFVNVAGRQRMLSQKMVKISLLIDRSEDKAYRTAQAHALQAVRAEWEKAHLALQQGDVALRLPMTVTSDSIRRAFAQIDPYFQAMVQSAQVIQAIVADQPPTASISQPLQVMLANEDRFLTGMDRIVGMYENEAIGKVDRLRRIELGLLLITLCALIAEAILIFRPAIHQISRYIHRLKASEEQQRRTIEAIPHPLLTIDEQGDIQYVNEEFEKVFGYKQEEVVGKTADFLFPKQHQKAQQLYQQQYLNSEGNLLRFDRLFPVLAKDAEEVMVSVSLNTLVVDEKRVIIAILEDMTEFQEKQHTILAQSEALEQIAQQQNHDLRRPVANIIGLVDILISDEDMSEEERERYLGYLKRTTQDLDTRIRLIIGLVNTNDVIIGHESGSR